MAASLLEHAAKKLGAARLLESLSKDELDQLQYCWPAWARPEQLPPDGDWLTWLVLAGRGFGKTKAGAEWVRRFAYENPGCRIALIGRTAADVRTTMLEGPSGLLSISPPDFAPNHEPSKTKLTWPNGSIALTFSAEEPKGLRGPQFHAAWCDELAAWPTTDNEDGQPGVPAAWTQLQYGMRLPGAQPRIVVTTTPRPTKVIRDLIADASTSVTRGSTFDNAANLSAEFIERMRDTWEGTRIGRQELYAEVLSDIDGALWSHDLIERKRIASHPPLQRVVVAVDPSGSAKKTADEAGIVVVGAGTCGCNGKPELHGFVLSDLSGRYSPADMARRVADAYRQWDADRVVAEDNFGGQIIADLMRLTDSSIAYKAVHASRGKIIRAEPVAALYERGRVHHVGLHAKLEDEQCTFAPGSPKSPGRLDAAVWGLTELILDTRNMGIGSSTAAENIRRAFDY